MKILLLLLTTSLCFAKPGPKIDLIIKGYDVIWSMAEIAPNRILFTTRNGTFKIVELQTKKVIDIKADLKVYNRGQGGLLDVSLHPDFAKNKKKYFTYSCEKGSSFRTHCVFRKKISRS